MTRTIVKLDGMEAELITQDGAVKSDIGDVLTSGSQTTRITDGPVAVSPSGADGESNRSLAA